MKFKFKLLTIAIATIFILMGCQGTNEEGMNDRNNTDRDNNIEQTRYNNDNTRDNRMGDRAKDYRNNNRGNVGNNRDNVRNDQNNNNNNDNNNQYSVSKEAADKITDEIAEIDSAYVLTTDNNAYVAAVLDNDNEGNNNANDNVGINDNDNNNRDGVNARNISNKGDTGSEVTDEVKKKISDIVQSVDNDIDNVYVTTNPDFADLTNDYVNDVNDGKPVEGFFDQIGNMVERVFPQDKR